MSQFPTAQVDACEACTASPRYSFCSLDEELRDGLRTILSVTRYRAGSPVYLEGEPCTRVYIVCEGSVKLVSTSQDGKVLLLRFSEPGEMLSVNAAIRQGPCETSAIAAEPSVIAALSRENLVRFAASDPRAMIRMVEAASHEYKSAQRKIRFLAFGSTASARMARLLLEWAEAGGAPGPDGVHIRTRVTHSDLAQIVGTTRETITRLLGELVREETIVRSAEEIVIRNDARLRSFLTY